MVDATNTSRAVVRQETEAFLAAVPEECQSAWAQHPSLEDDLHGAVEQMEPVLTRHAVPPLEWMAHLGRALGPRGVDNLGSSLHHAADLVLTCAVLLRRRGAEERLEEVLQTARHQVQERRHHPEHLVEEALDRLRSKLLVDGRLVQYSGQGPLSSYLRLCLAREVVTGLRAAGRQVEIQGDMLDLMPADHDVESALLQRMHRDTFKRAFADAFATLEEEDRELLRLTYRNQLTMEQLGARLGIHKATAARRVVKARAQLYKRTRSNMVSALHLSREEAHSLMRALRSQVSLTLEWGEVLDEDRSHPG